VVRGALPKRIDLLEVIQECGPNAVGNRHADLVSGRRSILAFFMGAVQLSQFRRVDLWVADLVGIGMVPRTWAAMMTGPINHVGPQRAPGVSPQSSAR